jgi:signal transduction histidine kinase
MRMPQQRDLDALPCYVTVQDRALRVVAANARFVEAFGPIADRRCYQIYKRQAAPCERCPVERTFRDGGCHDGDEHVWNLQGRTTGVLVFTAPIHDARGRIVNVLEMCGDVTPIRELQSQLASLGLLIGSVSHSIKGLLPGLDGGIHLVSSGLAQDDLRRVARGWEMIGRSTTRIRSLVLDMLYYAKDREPFLRDVEVASVVEDARTAVEERAREHGVVLRCTVDEETGRFEVDPRALRALVVILLENAVDACRADTHRTGAKVDLHAWGDAEAVRLEVACDGVSMCRSPREVVFLSSAKWTGNVGLDLLIPNKIARAHGGRIDVRWTRGEGTCIRATIPRRSTKPAT